MIAIRTRQRKEHQKGSKKRASGKSTLTFQLLEKLEEKLKEGVAIILYVAKPPVCHEWYMAILRQFVCRYRDWDL